MGLVIFGGRLSADENASSGAAGEQTAAAATDDGAPDDGASDGNSAEGSGDESSSIEPGSAAATEAVDITARVAANNAWMLTSCALVLFMTAPGLAMFYGGLVRKKNVLSVMMQCIFLMGLMTVLWGIYGYSLSFGGDNPYIGNGEYLMMNNVQRTWDEEAGEPVTPMLIIDDAPVIPLLTHMLFQG
ncbi:MAG: ammonium transporter, partial [Planctomycetales bacterium]|nr:ammonium transporter [Planctomycetales bacterium]